MEVRVSTPALLTMMSTRPNSLTAVAISFCKFGDLADIGLHADGTIAQSRDLFFQRFGRLGMRDVINDDVRALPAPAPKRWPCRCRCCRR